MINYRTCPGCKRLFPLGQYADEASCPACQAIWRRDHRARLRQRRARLERWLKLEENDSHLDQVADAIPIFGHVPQEGEKESEEEKELDVPVSAFPTEHWKYLTPRQRDALKKRWS